jgi:hypothetical protein
VASEPIFTTNPPAKKKLSRGQMLTIGAGVLLVAAIVGYLEFAPKRTPEEIPLTEEAKGYISNLALADVNMEAKLDYFGQKVVEITGSIGNTGQRGLKVVEVTCVFRDYANRVILRQRTPIVSAKMGGLNPGDTKAFRLPFDTVPEGWNQQMPQLVIAGIEFQ